MTVEEWKTRFMAECEKLQFFAAISDNEVRRCIAENREPEQHARDLRDLSLSLLQDLMG